MGTRLEPWKNSEASASAADKRGRLEGARSGGCREQLVLECGLLAGLAFSESDSSTYQRGLRGGMTGSDIF